MNRRSLSWTRTPGGDLPAGRGASVTGAFLTRVAMRGRSRQERLLAGLVALAFVVALGVLDRLTSAAVSLAVVYVLVVAAVTMYSEPSDGLLVAVASTFAWVIGDSALAEARPLTYVVNGVLRFAALTIVAILVDRLVAASTSARKSEQMSREFLATAAHQLRTPVAGIRASADALFHLDASPEQEALLGALVGEAARAGQLISSLLRVARLDQGESFRLETIDLRRVVEAEVTRARALTTVDVALSAASDGAEHATFVSVDVSGTSEAIANLLDNARRHARTTIEVSVARDDQLVRLSVRDDGPGLAAGTESHVFERFVSLDGRGGSGLGLAIAQQIARMHGGDLDYVEGAFVLTLPPAD